MLNFSCRREVIVTSSVLACEVAKVILLLCFQHLFMRFYTFYDLDIFTFQVICAISVLIFDGSFTKLCKDWSLLKALTFSGLPAAIYALQNSSLQISYKNLDSLTFSMLNQTKLFFTAFFGFMILRYALSKHSCLLILLKFAEGGN